MACTSLQIRGKKDKHLPISTFFANVDVQIATAFVTITADFIVNSKGAHLLEIPIGSDVTVTGCTIETNKRFIQTSIVSKSDFDSYSSSHSKTLKYKSVKAEQSIFGFPFELKKKDKTLHVTLTYFKSLTFDPENGRYSFGLPSTFDARQTGYLNQVRIQASINASQYFQWGSVSHTLRIIQDVSPTHKVFEIDRWENKDFEISYAIHTPEILCSLLVNDGGVDPFDPRSTFNVNIHPPLVSQLTHGFFGRRIVFLIDVSGSMSGEPMAQARNALSTGLSQLRHYWDQFTIIAFNHEMVSMGELVEATPEAIASALEFVSRLYGSGGTNILTPVQNAVAILNKTVEDTSRIPMVFLLTDGAVNNEKDIRNWVESNSKGVRFHTLGIGEYCNAYFLKMVAMAGRGLNDHIVDGRNIFKQVLGLLRSATTPILTNIQVLLPVQSHEYEIFPYPIPDLFCGNPLVISGKASVPFDHALVQGLLPNGQMFQVQIPILRAPIELHKVFARQRLDYMIGQAWKTDRPEDVNAVVRMACMYSIPTPYTVLVGYEVKPSMHSQRKAKNTTNLETIEGIMLVSMGAIIVITGLSLAFGDVAGTMANAIMSTSVFYGDNMFFGGPGGGGGSTNCGNCNCSGDGGCCNCCDCCDCCHHNGGGGHSGDGCCDNGGCCDNNGNCCDNSGGGCCDNGGCCDGGGCCGDCGGCDCSGCDCGNCDCNCGGGGDCNC